MIEAHESTLRALVLTADGSKLATASHKGTIVRVWDVGTTQNIYEFRRGVERANITCLAFSWDDQWISCTSDKGTTHIFFLENEAKEKQSKSNRKNNGSTANQTSKSLSTSSILGATGSSLLSSGSRLLMGSFAPSAAKAQPKSVCQIRGVPHPLACAFIADAPHLVAVAGWDNDGNGVLLISEYAAQQEPRRVAYHVLVKNSATADESEEQRRRRRARGWVPSGIDSDPSNHISANTDDPRMHFGHLRISDALAEESHRFQTQTTDDDFCEVIVEPRKEPIIEDKPPDRLMMSSSKNEHELQLEKPTKEKDALKDDDDAQDDIFVAAKETEEELEGASNENDGKDKTKSEEPETKGNNSSTTDNNNFDNKD